MRLKPAFVPPPGETVTEEYQYRGWTLGDLADKSGLSTEIVAGVANGELAITPEIAEGFQRAFGTSAQFWLNMENNYQEFKATADYSGKILFRGPKELHRRLAKQAEEEGVSLNQLVLYLMTDALNQRVNRKA